MENKKKFIKNALASLNATDRLVITLFYLKELSLDEIAEITTMQANTVKVRLHIRRLKRPVTSPWLKRVRLRRR